jgi:LysM repeat protein
MADDHDDEIYDDDIPEDGEPAAEPVEAESPDSALPSGGLYLGSLIALALATVVGVILFISPPEERSTPSSAPVGGEAPLTEPTATPTPTRTDLTPTVIVTPTPSTAEGEEGTGTPQATTTEQPDGTETYTIESGDTLFGIAEDFNTTVDEIIELNPGIEPDNLTPGDELIVPAPAD